MKTVKSRDTFSILEIEGDTVSQETIDFLLGNSDSVAFNDDLSPILIIWDDVENHEEAQSEPVKSELEQIGALLIKNNALYFRFVNDSM